MPVGMTFSFKTLGDFPPETLAGEWMGRFLGEMTHRVGISGEGLLREPAPFTISSPMPLDAGRSASGPDSDHRSRAQAVRQGERFRLRMSWLADEDLRGLLDWARTLRVEPFRLETGEGPLLVENALVADTLAQRWNRWVPYSQLFDEASDSLRLVTLKFYSPTALRRSNTPYPLPDPQGIFVGYREVWDAFSGIPLAPGLREAMEEQLRLVDFRLRRRLSEEGRESVPGFVGSATIQLQGRHPESVLKGLNVLADYAFFCGTGIHTGRGMGLTRRILEQKGRT